MKILLSISATALLLFSGCATNEGPEYDGHSYNQIKRYNIGTVQTSRPVVIKDDGTGKFIGAISGAVLGSLIGGGKGSVLASLGGGLGGYYAGSEVGKANGEELSVKLDNGESIVVVIKGDHYDVGDRVKIIKNSNGTVANVSKIN